MKGSGNAFQGHTYRLVSSAIDRLKAAPRAGRRLRHRVERLPQVMDESQKRTVYLLNKVRLHLEDYE